MNTTKKPEEVELKGWRVATVDATGIALELNLLVAGLPVVNSAIVGAFARATDEVKLQSVLKVIKESWPGAAGEKKCKSSGTCL